MKPYLALFRAGASSLHPSAIEGLDQQNFDYALSWFGDEPPHAPGAVFVHEQKGAKWPGLAQTLAQYASVIGQYRYVWLPDDDLLCVPEQVSRMFMVCEDLKLELAQPALTVDSYFSHVVTLRHSQFQVRFTNFVEIMAPIFSASMLQRILPTLPDNISGYGLDGIWPRLSGLGRVAIIDDTPVKHTRPVGGPNYKFNQGAGLSPIHEDWMESAAHFVETEADFHLNLAGVLQDGKPICIGGTPLEIEAMLVEIYGSLTKMRLTATQMTRYLANHLIYGQGGSASRMRYPRAALRLVLNKVLAGTGIEFPDPQAGKAASPSASTNPA